MYNLQQWGHETLAHLGGQHGDGSDSREDAGQNNVAVSRWIMMDVFATITRFPQEKEREREREVGRKGCRCETSLTLGVSTAMAVTAVKMPAQT